VGVLGPYHQSTTFVIYSSSSSSSGGGGGGGGVGSSHPTTTHANMISTYKFFGILGLIFHDGPNSTRC